MSQVTAGSVVVAGQETGDEILRPLLHILLRKPKTNRQNVRRCFKAVLWIRNLFPGSGIICFGSESRQQ